MLIVSGSCVTVGRVTVLRGHVPALARGGAGPGDLGEPSADVASVGLDDDDGGHRSRTRGVEGGGLGVVFTGSEDDKPCLLRSTATTYSSLR